MAIGMNANFGNFNPAQYQREDNTLSSIGNRFANVAANIPGLVREGEKWQDERDARGRAQEARNSDENLKTHLYNGMQELNNELGGGAFQLRPPERGESIENYTAYTGNVLQSVLDNNPGAYDKVMQAATKVGAKLNSDDALERYALGQQGAETQGQGVGGMLSPQPAQEQPPARANRFEGLGGASNEGALAMIQAAGEQQGGFENDPNSSGMRNILLNSGDPELRTASSYIQSLPRDEYPQESISGQTQPDGIPTMIQPPPATGQPANRFANVTPERAATLRAAMADTKNRIDNLTARINNLYAERRMSPERIWKHEDRLDKLQEKYDKYDAELNGLPKTEKVDPNADLTREKIEAEIENKKANTKYQKERSRGGNQPNLYSPMQTGNEQAQNNAEQARNAVIDLQRQHRDATDKGLDTSNIEKNLATAIDNLRIAENAQRYAAKQTAYLGDNDTNIRGYADNISKNVVMDLNRRLGTGVVEQLPIDKNAHGQLTMEGKPLFSGANFNSIHYERLGKMLDNLTYGHNLDDDDKIQIINEVISILKARNIASLKEYAQKHVSKRR